MKVKNLGLLYKAKHYVNKESLVMLYYSFIHTYTNYGNIAWGSTNRTNLEKINIKQKYSVWVIHSKDRFTHARKLFRENKTLNIFQLNIYYIKSNLKQHQQYFKTSSVN